MAALLHVFEADVLVRAVEVQAIVQVHVVVYATDSKVLNPERIEIREGYLNCTFLGPFTFGQGGYSYATCVLTVSQHSIPNLRVGVFFMQAKEGKISEDGCMTRDKKEGYGLDHGIEVLSIIKY